MVRYQPNDHVPVNREISLVVMAHAVIGLAPHSAVSSPLNENEVYIVVKWLAYVLR